MCIVAAIFFVLLDVSIDDFPGNQSVVVGHYECPHNVTRICHRRYGCKKITEKFFIKVKGGTDFMFDFPQMIAEYMNEKAQYRCARSVPLS